MDRNIRNGIKIAYWNKITKAVFVAEPRFDGKAADEGLSSSPEQTPQKDGRNGRKRSRSRKRAGIDSRQISNNKRAICWVYSGWHGPSTYVLFIGKNPKGHKVLKDNQKRFDDNLKDKIFKKDVEMFKAVAQTTDEIRGRRKPSY